MVAIMQLLRRHVAPRLAAGEQIACVFNRNEQVASYARRIYERLLSLNPEWAATFGPISFESRRERVELQIADVMAYENRLYLEADWKLRLWQWRPLMNQLIQLKLVAGQYCREAELQEVVQRPEVSHALEFATRPRDQGGL
jgi:hypothetical protein